MRIRINHLLRWTRTTCRAAIDAARPCTRDLPEYLFVLNDIYGVSDLSSPRR
jgi:hypothetical protein